MKTWLDAIFCPDTREHFTVCSGEGVEDEYKVHYDRAGVRHLRPDGKRNTYDEIQSHRESCDINLIIKRYYNGDFTALDRTSGQYLDITQFPETYAEWFEKGKSAERYFNSLDPETRALFNNSFEQFLSQEVSAPFPADYKKEEIKKEETVSES